jgi:hypothetical protein
LLFLRSCHLRNDSIFAKGMLRLEIIFSFLILVLILCTFFRTVDDVQNTKGKCPAPGYTMKCRVAPHVVVFSIVPPSRIEMQYQSFFYMNIKGLCNGIDVTK